MAMQYREPEPLSLHGDLTRERALDGLLRAGPLGGKDVELVMFAGAVTRVDVVTGAAARLRIGRHLREHPEGQVTIERPRDGRVAERFLELLSPLPDRVLLSTDHEMPDQHRFALVPATQIADSEQTRLAGEFALQACERARVSGRRAKLIGATVMELADNALNHASGSDDDPVIAVTVAGRERYVEIASVDLGRGLGEESALDSVARIPGARDGNGFLSQLIRLGVRRNLKVSIEIIAGVARLRWTWSAHRAESGIYVPGTAVIVKLDA